MRAPLAQPVAQLDGSRYENVNCGPACGAMALRHASANRVAPSPSTFRARGDMGTGPTGFDDVKRGVAAFARDFAEHGLAAPNLIRLGYIDLPTLRSTLVLRNALHIIALRYEPVLDFPEYRGDDDYAEGHFVCARMLYRRYSDGSFRRVRPRELPTLRPASLDNLWTEVLDPLADGRRPRIPQAPQRWPLALLAEAGDAFYDPRPYNGQMAVAVAFRAKEV